MPIKSCLCLFRTAILLTDTGRMYDFRPTGLQIPGAQRLVPLFSAVKLVLLAVFGREESSTTPKLILEESSTIAQAEHSILP